MILTTRYPHAWTLRQTHTHTLARAIRSLSPIFPSLILLSASQLEEAPRPVVTPQGAPPWLSQSPPNNPLPLSTPIPSSCPLCSWSLHPSSPAQLLPPRLFPIPNAAVVFLPVAGSGSSLSAELQREAELAAWKNREKVKLSNFPFLARTKYKPIQHRHTHQLPYPHPQRRQLFMSAPCQAALPSPHHSPFITSDTRTPPSTFPSTADHLECW